jgi:hypothetical protein
MYIATIFRAEDEAKQETSRVFMKPDVSRATMTKTYWRCLVEPALTFTI